MKIIEQETFNLAENIVKKKDDYLKSQIKPIWLKPILKHFLCLGLYIVENKPSFYFDEKTSNITYRQTIQLIARNKFWEWLFLKGER